MKYLEQMAIEKTALHIGFVNFFCTTTVHGDTSLILTLNGFPTLLSGTIIYSFMIALMPLLIDFEQVIAVWVNLKLSLQIYYIHLRVFS